MIIDKVLSNIEELVKDQYGNYVVQYTIELKQSSVNGRIVDKLQGQFARLSNEKFSSNVVEKVLHIFSLISAAHRTQHSYNEKTNHRRN